MGNISNYLENKWLDHILKVASYTRETTLYVGLSTADPLDDASGISEPAGGAYARLALTDANWTAAAARATNYNALLTFVQATGAWGTITHWFICTHLSNTTWGTNVELIAHGSLTTPKSVVSGNTPSIAAGEIEISVNSGAMSNFLAHEMLDHTFLNSAYTPPTNIYAALSTANPTDAFTGLTEPSGNNYARVAHNSWDAAVAGASENTGVIQFATPSGSWGLITYGALLDAITGGNGLLYATATPNQTPDSGDDVEYPDGTWDVTLA